MSYLAICYITAHADYIPAVWAANKYRLGLLLIRDGKRLLSVRGGDQ